MQANINNVLKDRSQLEATGGDGGGGQVAGHQQPARVGCRGPWCRGPNGGIQGTEIGKGEGGLLWPRGPKGEAHGTMGQGSVVARGSRGQGAMVAEDSIPKGAKGPTYCVQAPALEAVAWLEYDVQFRMEAAASGGKA